MGKRGYAGDVTSIATAWQQKANECQSRTWKVLRICLKLLVIMRIEIKRNDSMLVYTES